MAKRWTPYLCALGLTLACSETPSPSLVGQARADTKAPAGAASGFAVVELFTSEGCSSCPPADAIMAEVVRKHRERGDRVFALEFHVDYWNELGWPDPFSSSDFAERQRSYAARFGGSGLYTPEMVVNGVDHFVGSDGARAEASVTRWLGKPPPIDLRIAVSRSGPRSLEVRPTIAAGAAPPDAVLWVGLVQSEATVRVPAGENAGRTLHHTGIVRAMSQTGLDALSGAVVLRFPSAGSDPGEQVVALVQGRIGDGDVRVLGAAQAAAP